MFQPPDLRRNWSDAADRAGVVADCWADCWPLGCLTQVAPGAPRSAPAGPPERAVRPTRASAAARRPRATWGDLGCLRAGLNPDRRRRLPSPRRPGRSPHMTDTSACKPHGATATLTTDTVLTIRPIVDLTGRDRKTVAEWIRAGVRYPDTVQDRTGRREWRVPVKDLVAAGDLEPSQVVEVAAVLESLREARQVGELRARIVELEKGWRCRLLGPRSDRRCWAPCALRRGWPRQRRSGEAGPPTDRRHRRLPPQRAPDAGDHHLPRRRNDAQALSQD